MATFRSNLLAGLVVASVACAQTSPGATLGAEGDAFLLVNEVDIEMWETTVQTTTLDVPQELVLDSGTYYWAVGAFKGGRQVAYSGRSAFVVLK